MSLNPHVLPSISTILYKGCNINEAFFVCRNSVESCVVAPTFRPGVWAEAVVACAVVYWLVDADSGVRISEAHPELRLSVID